MERIKIIDKSLNDDCRDYSIQDCKEIHELPETTNNFLKNLIKGINKQIPNKKAAEDLFHENYFVQLTMEDVANSTMSFGGHIPDMINTLNTYIIPTYLELLDVNEEPKKNIEIFFTNTENNFNSIEKNLNNFFSLKRFFENMEQENFFENIPMGPEFYDRENQPELYVYSTYFHELETNSELFLETIYKGHAISSIIKKINVDNYTVSIIDTGDGAYSEIIFYQQDEVRGNLNIKSRGILTFEINTITDYYEQGSPLTAIYRILKYIYFFSNYSHFINKLEMESLPKKIQLSQETFYGKIVPLLLTDKNGHLVKNGKKQLALDSTDTPSNNIRLINYARVPQPWEILPIQSISNCYLRAVIYGILWKIGSIDIPDSLEIFNNWLKKVQFYETIKGFFVIYKFKLSSLKYQNIFNELYNSYYKKLKTIEDDENKEFIEKLHYKINLRFIKFLSGIDKNKNIIGNNKEKETLNNKLEKTEKTKEKLDNRFIKHQDTEPIVNSSPSKFKYIDAKSLKENLEEFNKIVENLKKLTSKEKISGGDLHILGNYYILIIENSIEIIYDKLFGKEDATYNITYPLPPGTVISSDSKKVYELLSTILENYIAIRTRIPIFSPQFDQSPLYCLSILEILGKLLIPSHVSANIPTDFFLTRSLLLERVACSVPVHERQKKFYEKVKTNKKYSFIFLMLNEINVEDTDEFMFEEIFYQKSFNFKECIYLKDIFTKTITLADQSVQNEFLINLDNDIIKRLTLNNISFIIKVANNNLKNIVEIKKTKAEKTEAVGELEKNINNIQTKYTDLNLIIKIILMCNLPIIPPIGYNEFNNIDIGYTFLNSKKIKVGGEESFNTEAAIRIQKLGDTYYIQTQYSMLYFCYYMSYIRGKNILKDDLKQNEILKKYICKDKLHIPSEGKILQEIEMLCIQSEIDKNYDINYISICENYSSYGSDIFGDIEEVTPFIPDNLKIPAGKIASLKTFYESFKTKMNKERKFMISYLHDIIEANKANKINFSLKQIKNVIFYDKKLETFNEKIIDVDFEFNNFEKIIEKVSKKNNSNFMDIDKYEKLHNIINIKIKINKVNDSFDIDNDTLKTFKDKTTHINQEYDIKYIDCTDIISTYWFLERMLWYDTYDLLPLLYHITNDFYSTGNIGPNNDKPIPNEIYKAFNIESFNIVNKNFSIKKIEKTETIVNEIIKLFIETIYGISPSYYTEYTTALGSNIRINKINYQLNNFCIYIDQKIIIFDSENKILLEEDRNDKEINYKMHKYNSTFEKFEIFYEYTNELKPMFYNNKYLEIKIEEPKMNKEKSFNCISRKGKDNCFVDDNCKWNEICLEITDETPVGKHALMINGKLSPKKEKVKLEIKPINKILLESSDRCEVPNCLQKYYYWEIDKSTHTYTGKLINDSIKPYFLNSYELKKGGTIDYPDPNPQSISILSKYNYAVSINGTTTEILDAFQTIKKYTGKIVDLLFKLSNSIDLTKIAIIKDGENYEIYLKQNIKIIIKDNKIYFGDETMEIILSNDDKDYNISRFFRFVAGLDGVYLIKEKIVGKDEKIDYKYKILSFQNFKVKRKDSDYVINTISNEPTVGWIFEPKINNYFITFKNFSSNETNLILFDLHESGLHITNLNYSNINIFIKLIRIYLAQDKIDIGRQLINQLYNLLYTLPFIEKIKILFNNELNLLLKEDWNYSSLLIDKINLIGLYIDAIDMDFYSLDQKLRKDYDKEITENIEKFKSLLDKNILHSEILNNDRLSLRKYITKKYLIELNSVTSPYKLNYLLKYKISLPKLLQGLTITFPLKKSIIFFNLGDEEVFTKNYSRNKDTIDFSMYNIYDGLFLRNSIYPKLNLANSNFHPPIGTEKNYFTFFLGSFNQIIALKSTENPINVKLPLTSNPSKLESIMKMNENINMQLKIYKHLIKTFLNIPEIKLQVTGVKDKISTTKKNKFVKEDELSEQLNDFNNNKEDYKIEKYTYTYAGHEAEMFKTTIDKTLINKIEKYLNSLIYFYNESKQTNNIYNSVCSLTAIGIHFITTFLFLKQIKEIPLDTTITNDNLMDFYNKFKPELLNNGISKIVLLYEFMSGFFLRKSQVEYIKNIIQNFNDNKSRIYQIEMGLGKTSVLGPLISIIYSQLSGKNVINIMPGHLINQAEEKYLTYLTPLLPINLRIFNNNSKSNNPYKIDMSIKGGFIYLMSDKIAKIIYLNSKIGEIIAPELELSKKFIVDKTHLQRILDRSVSLIDEIDSLSDSRKSELNYPKSDNKNVPVYLDFRISEIIKLIDKILELKEFNDNIKEDENGNLIVNKFNDDVKTLLIRKLVIPRELMNTGTVIVGNVIDGTVIDATIDEDKKYILKHIYHDNLPTCLKQEYEVNYGLKSDAFLESYSEKSNDPKFNLLAVPYEAARKPAAESKFSDIDLTLFYTYYSLKKNKTLRDYDISKLIDIYKNKHNAESKILNTINTSAIKSFKDLFDDQTLELSDYNSMNESKDGFKILKGKLGDDKYVEKKKNLLKNTVLLSLYLKELIIDGSNLPSEFNDNISFLDLISSSFTKTRVGFSGTPSKLVPMDIDPALDFRFDKVADAVSIKYLFKQLEIDTETDSNIYSEQIGGVSPGATPEKEYYIKQKGAYKDYIESMFAIHTKQIKEGKNDKFNIYIYKDDPIGNLKKILKENKHKCLIDVGALFKGTPPFELAKIIDKEKSNPPNWNKTVYMDIINNKNKYVSMNKELDYLKSDQKEGDFIYYDNSNIVGTDLKQKDDVRGLITIGKNSTFTEFSQGLYRLRKLKEGQRADFLIHYDVFKEIHTNLSDDKFNYQLDDEHDEILVKICKFLIKNEEELEEKNKFNFYIQNARVIYRNSEITSNKDIIENSINTHKYQVRGFINKIEDVNKEHFIVNKLACKIDYQKVIGNYYKNIIEYINDPPNSLISECLTKLESPDSSSTSTIESLSQSQSMQLNLAMSLSESQFSRGKGSPYLKFNYYLKLDTKTKTKQIAKTQHIATISPNKLMETSYRSNKLTDKMSIMNLIICKGENIYLTTNQTSNLFGVGVTIVLATGKDINGNVFNTVGSGYAKLKNGNSPSSFKEVWDLLKDFGNYDADIIIKLPEPAGVSHAPVETAETILTSFMHDRSLIPGDYILEMITQLSSQNKSAKEILKQLNDMEVYDGDIPSTPVAATPKPPIKIRTDILNQLKNSNTDIRVLPFKNIIMNMFVAEKNDKVNLLPEGDFMYTDGNLDDTKFQKYLKEIVKPEKLSEMLKYTCYSYNKDEDILKISSVDDFINIDSFEVSKKEEILQHGGNNNLIDNKSLNKYLKYKTKYLRLKESLFK